MAGAQTEKTIPTGLNAQGGSMVDRADLEARVRDAMGSQVNPDDLPEETPFQAAARGVKSAQLGTNDEEVEEAEPSGPAPRKFWRTRGDMFTLERLITKDWVQDDVEIAEGLTITFRSLIADQVMKINEEFTDPDISLQVFSERVNLKRLSISMQAINGGRPKEGNEAWLRTRTTSFLNFLLREYFEFEDDVQALLTREKIKN